jgi:hypothetical protein
VPSRGTTCVPELPGKRPAAVAAVPLTAEHGHGGDEHEPAEPGDPGSGSCLPRTSRDASSSVSTASATSVNGRAAGA